MAEDESGDGRRQQQDAWIVAVLGIAPPRPAATATATSAAPSADVRATWRDAKESADAGLEQLARALRAYDDPDLTRIADLGLFGLGKGETVRLNKALIEFSAAAPDRRPAAARALRDAVAAYRQVIAGPLAGEIDNNPFGVTVGLRATLGPALDQIERAAA